jgi:arylsulfatase A-like enzyme
LTLPRGHDQPARLTARVQTSAPPSERLLEPLPANRLPLEIQTLAEALREDGYRTAHFGKWHLGWEPYQPQDQGFDVNLPGGSYPGPPSYRAPYQMPGFADGEAGEHIDLRLADEAIRFMREAADRPFFLNFWPFSVHAPFQAAPELVALYRALADPLAPQHNPVMGGMMHTLDQALGRILDELDRLGLTGNTLFLFSSDNGGNSLNAYDNIEGGAMTDNAPLRGGKGTIYEGGTRVPLIAVWPGRIEPNSRSEAIVSSIDFYPTILDMLGLAPPAGQVCDGLSFRPVLTGTGHIEREAIFCHYPHTLVHRDIYLISTPASYVRSGPWKLIRFHCDNPDGSDRLELYNLDDDIGETENLAGRRPGKAQELNALMSRFLQDTHALTPRLNPAFSPASRPQFVRPDAIRPRR